MDDAAVRSVPGPGRVLKRIFRSSVGLKYIMALTGLALVGFLVGHLIGNLLIFKGYDALNAYAVGLHNLGPALWVLRIGVLAAAVLHIVSAYKLTLLNKRARPVAYFHQATLKATYAARTMRWSGVIVLAYVFYHLAHFTWGMVDPDGFSLATPAGTHDVFNMVVRSFSDPRVSGMYIVAQLLTGWHLSHGFSSAFQSLGLMNGTWRPLVRVLGPLLGWGISLGFILIPVAVLAQWVTMKI